MASGWKHGGTKSYEGLHRTHGDKSYQLMKFDMPKITKTRKERIKELEESQEILTPAEVEEYGELIEAENMANQ